MSDLPGIESVLPPANKEAEESLVGSILLNPASLDTIGYITELDFYFQTPRVIWIAMQKLREENIGVDFLTISDKLERMGELEGLGGPAKLVSIINAANPFFSESYAKLVKDLSQRRSLLQSATALAKTAYDLEHPIAEPSSKILDGIINISASPDKAALPISVGLNELLEFVNERRQDPRNVWGIPTGFTDFDAFTGGQHPGLITYIAGSPGAGKTKLALQMGIQAALPENGSHGVAVYSLEMPQIEIVKRAVSGQASVTTREMNTGKIDDEKYLQLLNDIAMLERLPIYICDQPISLAELHADLTRLKKQKGIELFVLDYLMLMQGSEDMDETPRSALLSRGLKTIARSTNLAGIAVSSTTKENLGSGNIPTMKDMRGSAQVLFDADGIVFLQPSMAGGAQNIAELHWIKMPRTVNRSLGGNVLEILIDSVYPIFHNAEDRIKSVNLNGIN